MKHTSYFVFAFLFSVVLFISGCSNDNITTPTAQSNSQTSGNTGTGDNVNEKIKKNSVGVLQLDGCSNCTVTFHCEYLNSSTPFTGATVDIYQGSTYITTAGVSDSGGNVVMSVGTISPGSYDVFAHTPGFPLYDYVGNTTYTHSQQSSYTVDIDMIQLQAK